MSKHIFKYDSEQAYAAAANNRPSDASNVALAGLLAKYHGINVITDTSNPEAGDACFFDKLEGKRVLVKHGTFVRSLMDTDRYFNCNATVVGNIYGKVVTVDDNNIPGVPYASPDEWTLTGFDLTASGSATITAKYYSASGNYVKEITLEWAAGASIDTIIANLNAVDGFKSYCAASKLSDDSIFVTVSGYSSAMGLTVDSGDITATQTYRGYQTQYYGSEYSTTIERENGRTGDGYAFTNLPRYLLYYPSNGVNGAVTFGAGEPCRKSAFTMETNPTIYQQFGGDYDAYLLANFEAAKAKYPVNRYVMKDFAFGHNDLANVSHTNALGQRVWDFPIVHNGSLSGVTLDGFTTGFEPGAGHLGGLAEAHLLYSQVETGNTDPVNTTILANNGAAASHGTHCRLAFQSNSYTAWVFSGTYGGLYCNYSRCSASGARVFRAFDLETF